jgi:hypothetical protein
VQHNQNNSPAIFDHTRLTFIVARSISVFTHQEGKLNGMSYALEVVQRVYRFQGVPILRPSILFDVFAIFCVAGHQIIFI